MELYEIVAAKYSNPHQVLYTKQSGKYKINANRYKDTNNRCGAVGPKSCQPSAVLPEVGYVKLTS